VKLSKVDLITIALAVLVPAVAYFGYFQRRVAHLKTLGVEVAELDQKTADSRQVTRDITRARDCVRKLEERISRFMSSVTSENDAHRAVGMIVNGAKEAGVNIESMRPGEPVQGRTLNYFPIELAATGQFPKFYDFLLRVERGKTVMTVNRMEIESDSLSDRCSAKIQLRVYFVKPEFAAGKGTQA